MALGKQNKIDGKAYSLKLMLKENGAFLDKPVFAVSEKGADGKWNVTSKETDVSGDLIGLEFREGEYEGSPIYNVTLNLRDSAKNEIYFTQYTIGNSIGRGLSNSLLNLPGYTNVQLGLYSQTNQQTKKVYPAISLRQGNESATVKWKFDPKETKELQPREFEGRGGKTERDYLAVDAFLFAQLQELDKTIRASRPANTPTESAPAPEVSENQTQDGSDKDVPF